MERSQTDPSHTYCTHTWVYRNKLLSDPLRLYLWADLNLQFKAWTAVDTGWYRHGLHAIPLRFAKCTAVPQCCLDKHVAERHPQAIALPAGLHWRFTARLRDTENMVFVVHPLVFIIPNKIQFLDRNKIQIIPNPLVNPLVNHLCPPKNPAGWFHESVACVICW